MSQTQIATQTESQPRLRLVGGETKEVPAWMHELRTVGWTVVKGALSEDKAKHYVDEAYTWLESFGLGFDRNDESTHKSDKLPWCKRGGLFNRFGIAHEQFVWDLKSEPGVVEKFEQIWGTNELLVSYDGMNLSVPEPGRPTTDAVFTPWPHVDQSPLRNNLQCVQGIVNLLPNGPEDGGLMVLQGSNELYTELWEHFDHKKPAEGWNKWEMQFTDDEMNQWLIEKGCKWVKVCAGPGDLLLWDSRTVHYGTPPTSTNPRFAAYVCYKPASQITEEAKQYRAEAFATRHNTAHDPSIIRVQPRLPDDESHPSYEMAKTWPLQQPELSTRAKQLAGIEAY